MDNKQYLDKIINAKIARPIGSHHPNFPNFIYPINYGYIPNTISGDGAEIKELTNFQEKFFQIEIITKKN